MAHLKIDRKKSPKFVVEMEDGALHQLDPMDVAFDLQSAGLDKVVTFDKKQRLALKEVFGLPSFSTIQIMEVLNNFMIYTEKLNKEVDWLNKLNQTPIETPSVIDIETAKILEKFPIENSSLKV